MPIAKMVRESHAKVARQANIVKLIAPIEGIHTLTTADVLADDVEMLLQSAPGDVF
jgi:hypothetical protein